MDNQDPVKKKLLRAEHMLGILIVLLIVTVYGIYTSIDPASDKAVMVAHSEPVVNQQSADIILKTIEQETADLNIRPPTVMPTAEKALASKKSIRNGDYTSAENTTRDVIAHSTLSYGRFSPFDIYMSNIANDSDPAFLEHLNTWVNSNNNSAIAHLIRAKYYLETGWRIRGSKFVSAIRPEHLKQFSDYMELAAADANKSLELDANNPYGYYLLFQAISSNGDTPQLKKAFLAIIKKYRDYYVIYARALDRLSPKWGGSVKAMYGFVDYYAGPFYAIGATENSPLKLLYLRLYANLLNTAYVDCYTRKGDELSKCVSGNMDKIVTPDLQAKVKDVFTLYKADPFHFTLAVQPILNDIVLTPGADAYAGKMLQLAASSMGTDNEMTEKNPGHNNYMLDEINAHIWYNTGFYENAEKKYAEALTDLESATFPDEEEKAQAQAEIYDGLSSIYNKTAQYDKMIAYQNAATMLAGNIDNSFRQLKCFGYYKLKAYTKAVQVCTELLENGENFQTRFWRAKAYEALGRKKEADDDYTMIAESEDNWRTSAAIQLTFHYLQQHETQKALDYFNSHPFLFDDKNEEKSDLAVNYNNRCYAYKELGQLQKALDDCNASLKYGNIPDAYQKQQELLKQLGAAAK